MKTDIHQTVTDQIIAAIQSGAGSVGSRWIGSSGQEPIRITGQPYQGINWLLLSISQDKRGFASPQWMTYRQAETLGGQVRKGEKGTPITFCKPVTAKETDADGNESERRGGTILRGYTVFNCDQIDGLPDEYRVTPPALPAKERDAVAEAALRSCGAQIVETGTRAFYSPDRDLVTLPDFDRFVDTGAHLATMAHELIHWTGHASRFDRLGDYHRNIEARAKEELIAEIGAAFLCARLGIAGEYLDSQAAYVASWLEALKKDKRAIFRAASAAQKAADLVLGKGGAA